MPKESKPFLYKQYKITLCILHYGSKIQQLRDNLLRPKPPYALSFMAHPFKAIFDVCQAAGDKRIDKRELYRLCCDFFLQR